MKHIDAKVMTITPEMASEMLENNVFNRPLSNARVGMYVDAMKAGEWSLNGEAIKFDETGRLLDGQHRLTSIIRSNIAIQSMVIRGLPAKSASTIDTGKNRTAADVLALGGSVSSLASKAFAAATRMLMIYEVGESWAHSTSGHRIRFSSNVMIENYVKIHLKELTAAHAWLTENIPRYGSLMPIGDLLFFFVIFSRKEPEYAKLFFLRVFKGLSLDDNCLEYTLRSLLLKRKQGLSTMSQGVARYTTVRVWNALQATGKISRPVWRDGDDVPFAI